MSEKQRPAERERSKCKVERKPLQNSPECVTAIAFASGVDFATAVALRRMAIANGAIQFSLLAPGVNTHALPASSVFCSAFSATLRARVREQNVILELAICIWLSSS